MKLYRKIDIYYQQGAGQWIYACSTMQHKTCKSAKQSWADIHLSGNTKHVKTRFARA